MEIISVSAVFTGFDAKKHCTNTNPKLKTAIIVMRKVRNSYGSQKLFPDAPDLQT
jgi:hypothetical protein